jgi:hypothetical protein
MTLLLSLSQLHSPDRNASVAVADVAVAVSAVVCAAVVAETVSESAVCYCS